MIYVVISHEDGTVSRMQFVERAPLRSLEAKGAVACGFHAGRDAWVREPTEANLQREIERAFHKSARAPVVGFQVVSEQEYREASRYIEPPRARRLPEPSPAQVGLPSVIEILAALDERLSLVDKKADEAGEKARKSLAIIDAIEQKTSNVAEGKV